MAALHHVEPGGINTFDWLGHLPRSSAASAVFDADFEVGLRIQGVGRIVKHRLYSDALTLAHTIAIAGHRRPVVHLATSAEEVFFLVRTQKIGAAGVPERDVM